MLFDITSPTIQPCLFAWNTTWTSSTVKFLVLVRQICNVQLTYIWVKKLMCYIITEPKPEVNLSAHKLLKVILSHYELVASSSFLWQFSFRINRKAKVMSAFFKPSFIQQKLNGLLPGITWLWTNDCTSTGLPEYQKTKNQTISHSI